MVDRSTGRIWLAFCRNRIDGDEWAISAGEAPRTVWMTGSGDDGRTWCEPVEITAAVKRPEWGWYATGPCHGVQLSGGRLAIPCNHRVLKHRHMQQDPDHSHVIYSDDHGATWALGGIADEGTNESTLLEASGGMLYLNSRNRHPLAHGAQGGHYRAVSWSADAGETFGPMVHDAALRSLSVRRACAGSPAPAGQAVARTSATACCSPTPPASPMASGPGAT